MPRILITRSPLQSSELAAHLRALGAEPILIPTIDIADPTNFAPLDTAILRLSHFHWLIFTSANAVEVFHRRLGFQPEPTSCTTENFPQTAAIGPATSRALEAVGIQAALVPPRAIAESLTDSLLPFALQPDGSATRFLLIRAESIGDTPPRDLLPQALRNAGAELTIAPAYRTIVPPASIDAIRDLFNSPATLPDAITFTSSSTARNFFTLLEAAGYSIFANPHLVSTTRELVILREAEDLLLPPQKPILASIGPITSATLRDLGHPPHIEAPEATVTSLAENLVKYLNAAKTA